MTSLENIIGSLKAKGHRITISRRAIVEAFTASVGPVAAADIIAMLKKKRVATDKTTVYREIEFLTKEGILREVQFDERSKRYELASGEHTHHLICTNCKKVDDAVLDHDLDDVEKRLQKQKKFKVQHHSLEFYGLCGKCQ